MNFLYLFYFLAVVTACFNFSSIFTSNYIVIVLTKLSNALFALSSALWMFIMIRAIDFNMNQLLQLILSLISSGVTS